MTPPAPSILFANARILTMGGSPGAKRGKRMNDLGVIERGNVLVQSGKIVSVTVKSMEPPAGCEVIDARGRVLMPGFVDAHTHALWAGDRLDEWDKAQAGASYLEILESGGGIMSTVRAVRNAPPKDLTENLRDRLEIMLREGTTTVEVKSGYGLTTDDELKMLRVIHEAGKGSPVTVIPTTLIGHAVDSEQEGFFETAINETLPAVHHEFPHIPIDAYCETGAWPLDQCVRLFERAQALGHPFRVHTDQFNELGMTTWALEHGALSVDHLEATSTDIISRIGASESAAVLLPCSGFQVDERYADGRALVDAGAHIVIATNCNPGSAPTSSMPMAIALAVRKCGLSPAEAICACTANAAALLGLDDRGFIAPGARADLVLLRHTDERALAYEFGGNPVDVVVCGGQVVKN